MAPSAESVLTVRWIWLAPSRSRGPNLDDTERPGLADDPGGAQAGRVQQHEHLPLASLLAAVSHHRHVGAGKPAVSAKRSGSSRSISRSTPSAPMPSRQLVRIWR